MRTTLRFILCIISTITISTQCKAQLSTGGQHVIDSLKIADPDEVAICKLYDDAVTEYLTEMQQYTANGARPTQAQTQAVSKKFHDREQAIKPQIESFKKKLASNYPQLMNFVQFCRYESMRVVGAMGYKNGAYPNYPMPAGH